MKFYATSQIGPKRWMTPEGFMVCEDVPIARTGEMRYLAEEVPVAPGPDGTVLIQREPEEVFRPASMASAAGKDVVDDHPPVDVVPSNWRTLSMGIVVNPRRGSGDEADVLLADLVIKDQNAIELIRDGKREVSCGYDAEYEELGPGLGRQRNIVINHVALVERGRCGPRCSISDHQKEPLMRTLDEKTTSAWDRLRARFMKASSLDKDTVAKFVDEAEKEDKEDKDDKFKDRSRDEGGTATHIHLPEIKGGGNDDEPPPWFAKHAESMDKRFGDLEGKVGPMLEKWAKQEAGEKEHQGDEAVLGGALEGEVPSGTTGDTLKKMKDSALMEDSFKSAIAGAEVLAPGITIPTFDSASEPKKTLDAVCGLRRNALIVAGAKGGPVSDMLKATGFDSAKTPCGTVRTIFDSAVAIQKAINNGATHAGGITTADKTKPGPVAGIRSIADLNAFNRKKYAPAAPAQK